MISLWWRDPGMVDPGLFWAVFLAMALQLPSISMNSGMHDNNGDGCITGSGRSIWMPENNFLLWCVSMFRTEKRDFPLKFFPILLRIKYRSKVNFSEFIP